MLYSGSPVFRTREDCNLERQLAEGAPAAGARMDVRAQPRCPCPAGDQTG